MSLKSLIQSIIILIIIIILGGVYYNYFVNNSKITLEKNVQTEIDTDKTKKKITLTENSIKKKKIDVEEKSISKEKIVTEQKVVNDEIDKVEDKKINLKKKIKRNKPAIDNVVKDIEYLTTDKNGNKYKILATSGRTNSEDKNILDLDNVRGIITSNKRSTVYIISDFAEYNASSLNSNFYQNVVINYEDKEITCDYFDVDMKTNIAKAYNNVVLKDPKSTMKAGKIILNIGTKEININPDNNKKKVSLTLN